MSIDPIERWLPVPGWEQWYQVSSLGRVHSHISGRVLNPAADKDGYPILTLARPHRFVRVHQLVAEAFIGPRPEGMEIRHLDGDAKNPTPTNLAYGTPSENRQDSLRHGTHANDQKKNCPQGHPYDEANTYVSPQGSRSCRACNRKNVAAYKARQRAAA